MPYYTDSLPKWIWWRPRLVKVMYCCSTVYLRPRIPPLCVFHRYFLIRHQGQVEIIYATLFALVRRKFFQCTPGSARVAKTLPICRILNAAFESFRA